MKRLQKHTIPEMLRNSFESYGQQISLVFVGEKNRTYADLSKEVVQLSQRLIDKGIRKGDKVALLSSNMPNWGISFFAITSIGAVAVPILPDFSENEIKNIISHSEARAIFISENLISRLGNDELDKFELAILVDNLENIIDKAISGSADEKQAEVDEDDLASIIYTSGTTGKSKGVMLTHRNIVWDAQQCATIQPIKSSDRFLSMLPLSHTFENTLGLLLPVMFGASVHYMKKPPTPSVMIPALKQVKPTIMLSVPLIIEKIFRKQIEPKFNSNFLIKELYKIAPVRKMLNKVAGKKLMKTFGGQVHFFGIGGAKLDGTVEKFLREAKFPYAIGYGLTETAPMIAGAGPFRTRWQAVGPVMEGVEMKLTIPIQKPAKVKYGQKDPM
jgi:Long-chain acyl-CoA synthetases (AMP-forming)